MTNDINTLNGALLELGETMASNLQEMGVTDADASDGLTTLADKILDIQTQTSPLTLTSDKHILSYYDSESAVLTANFVGAGFTVELYDDTDTLVGAMTDNDDGTYSYTYNSAGVGDIGFYAKVGSLVSETYSIEDCFNALLTEQSISNSSGTKISSVGLDTIYNIRNSNFSLEFTHTGNGVLNIGRASTWSSTTANYRCTIGYADGKHYYATRTTSSNESYGDTASTSTEYQYKLTRNGSTINFYVDDVLMGTKSFSTFASYDDWSIYSIIWGSGTSTISNIKLKPL